MVFSGVPFEGVTFTSMESEFSNPDDNKCFLEFSSLFLHGFSYWTCHRNNKGNKTALSTVPKCFTESVKQPKEQP